VVPMAEVKRTERGWPGHFICVSRCRFRRNTLLECGEQRVVVSTVGDMSGIDGFGEEAIGLDRHYETMAFSAVFEDPYWEADIGRQVPFDSPSAVRDVDRGSDLRANEMHEAVVDEISSRLKEQG